MFYVVNFQILMLSRSFFPHFGQGPLPNIAGKSPADNSKKLVKGIQLHDMSNPATKFSFKLFH